MKAKPTLATLWLDGCSGCHMSFLDMDEKLVELAARVELLYSPYMDTKAFPDAVDITLVEGAVSTEADLRKIREVRQKTKLLVAFGDCAVTGNVSAMKNQAGSDAVLEKAYGKGPGPNLVVPKLLERVMPLHEVVAVDLFLPGCPTPPEAIYEALNALIEGREPEVHALTRFGR